MPSVHLSQAFTLLPYLACSATGDLLLHCIQPSAPSCFKGVLPWSSFLKQHTHTSVPLLSFISKPLWSTDIIYLLLFIACLPSAPKCKLLFHSLLYLQRQRGTPSTTACLTLACRIAGRYKYLLSQRISIRIWKRTHLSRMLGLPQNIFRVESNGKIGLIGLVHVPLTVLLEGRVLGWRLCNL